MCSDLLQVDTDLPRGERWSAVVLGLGNLLSCDEGLGIHALYHLRERYAVAEQVRLVDGGTLGLELLSYLEDADHVLVLDAVLTADPPGTLVRMVSEELPAYFGMRTSPHEIALPDLLAVAKLRGTEPPELVVLGMRPERLELGWGLSATVDACLDALVDAAATELSGWGLPTIPCPPVAAPTAKLTLTHTAESGGV
jgi:hydrogenase maturation protease